MYARFLCGAAKAGFAWTRDGMKEESLGFARLGMLWEPRCTASGGMMATASASNPRLRDCDREAPGGVQEEDHQLETSPME